MVKNYLKTAWRSLNKQRATAFINITGLSIGMASAVLIFLWVDNENSFDNFHKEPENIYRIKNYVAIDKTSTWVWENSPYVLAEELQKQVPEVQSATMIEPRVYSIVYFNIKGNFFEERNAAYVDQNWFNVFKYDFVYGNAASFNSSPFTLALTESTARKYFGTENPIGKTILIDTINYTVQAVVKNNPVNSSFQYDVLMPLASKMANPNTLKNDNNWSNFNYLTFVRLLPSAKPEKVTAKVTAIYDSKRKENNVKAGLMPLLQMHFENDLQNSSMLHGNKKQTYIFGVLAILLLVIACINYVNLTTARASMRIKEVSIKKIVGAGKRQLLAQFIFESALISLIALVISVAIIKLVLPFFNQITEKKFSISLVSGDLWMILGGTLLVSVILTSIYPALLLSSFKPINIFRGMNMLKVKDAALRKVLVVTQFTISIILIVGVIVVYRQLQFINKTEQPYNRTQTLSIVIPYYQIFREFNEEKMKVFADGFKQALVKESSIENVAIMSQNSIVNMDGQSSGGADWDGRPEGFAPPISYLGVDDDFTKIVSLKLLSGRWFNNDPKADRHNVIMNETAVKTLNIREPVLGQRFTRGGDTGQIIGIIKDFHYKSMHEKIGSVVITRREDYSTNMLIKCAAGRIPDAVAATERAWKTFLPSKAFVYKFLDDEFNKIYHNDRKTSTLVWLFAIIAVIISCLGLFGLAAFTAERRIKEVGIRKVLGASVSGIVRLLSRDFIILVFIAFIIASPLAWWVMNKWLEDFAYRINISWWVFAIAGILSVFIAMLTISFQAIKAAISNPVKSLRTE